jgi:hypothetical protein
MMHIPTADDEIIHLMTVAMGGDGAVLALALVLWKLYGWYSTAKDAAERFTQARHYVGKTRDTLRGKAGARRMIAIIGTLLMLISQAIWLITAYVVGNVISVMFLYNKKIDQSPGASLPTTAQMLHALQFDAVSGSYTVIAVIGVIISYRSVLKGQDGDGAQGMGCLLGLPGYATAGFGLLFFVLTLLLKDVAHDPGYTSKEIELSFLAALAGAAYAASCHFVMGMPQLVARQYQSLRQYGA